MDSERAVQNKVINWLTEELGYKYLGNLAQIENKPIEKNLLESNLKKRGYEEKVITAAVNAILSIAENQADSLFINNKKIYSLLRYGKFGVENSEKRRITVNYIDWKNISANDFYVAEEVSVVCRDGVQKKRPDLVLYVNGIALGMCELKNSAVSAGEAIRQMLTNQKSEYIARFFSTVQILLAGNESQGIFYGAIETPEQKYLQWKEDKKATDNLSAEIKKLQGDDNNKLRKDIISLCHKERFLQLIHDFIIFDSDKKKIARHNQYFAIKAAETRIEKFFAGNKDETGGIIWDTQGSGKSLIMVWLTQYIKEHINDSRIVIITDR
jgi:type I restriction enzyme R subunit